MNYSIKPLDSQVSSKNNLIPNIPFSLLISASKGSGKTTLLLNLLNIYSGMFDRVIIFSPTVLLDDKWMNFINSKKILKVKKKNNSHNLLNFELPENQYIHEIYTEYDNEIIIKLRKNQEENHTKKNVLVIMEDSLGLEGVYKQNSKVLKYLPNSRHLSTSFIFVTQNYKSIPRLIRNNNSGFILFETPNRMELDIIYQENPCFLDKEEWYKLYYYVMNIPYQFMFFNYQNNREYQVIKNFDRFLKIKNVEEI